MNKIKTALAFTKNIATVGAFKESSPGVEAEICSKLNPKEDLIVVEFGMGHGNITRKILDRISPNSVLYSFEINEKFCEYVASAIDDSRLKIINDSAENVKQYVKSTVDYFIGSLPFSFLPKKVGKKIIADSYSLLKAGSYYSQYLYVKLYSKRFKNIYDDYEVVTIKSIPLEHVYHFRKE